MLTKEEEIKVARVAGSTMGKFFMGTAKVFKACGLTVEYTTKGTAKALRSVANVVEEGGEKTSKYLYEKADLMNKKAEDVNLNSIVIQERVMNEETTQRPVALINEIMQEPVEIN